MLTFPTSMMPSVGWLVSYIVDHHSITSHHVTCHSALLLRNRTLKLKVVPGGGGILLSNKSYIQTYIHTYGIPIQQYVARTCPIVSASLRAR